MKISKFIPVLVVILSIGLVLGNVVFAAKAEEIIPFGLNNPFKYSESDDNSETCLQNNSALTPGYNSSAELSYVERHIEPKALKRCLPRACGYMENIKDIGVNVISQHFPRRYDENPLYNGLPYFGLEEAGHRNHEVAIQLYVKGYKNYFWAAIAPESTKYFPGDIKIKGGDSSLPNSEAGFAEWKKWLSAMFDYLDKHNAADKLLYIQLGNEPDGDYARSGKDIPGKQNSANEGASRKIKKTKKDPGNPRSYHWYAYARLIEESYGIIKNRARPQTKIVIGAMGAGGVALDGFQRPVLEYLSGKIDEKGNSVHRERRCAGTGCFDAYDYHDFSKYKQYQGRIACKPRDCEPPLEIKIIKSPQTFRQLLNETGFPDKGLVVQQGGTYSGYDSQVNKLGEYQTEEDQASYLVKRAVYLAAYGVKQAQFGTYIEHFPYKDDKGGIHNWFTLMGLVYNGIPESGKCEGQLPCPDPGRDVKKLSYYAYKLLIEKLKGSDWDNVKLIETNTPNVYLCEFSRPQGLIYVAWWDWWKEYPRPEAEVEQCAQRYKGDHAFQDHCVNDINKYIVIKKNITFNFPQADKIEIDGDATDYAVAKESGITDADYEKGCVSSAQDVIGGKVELSLGKEPLYIKVISKTRAKESN